MFKNIIAPVQAWLLSQGRCVGCGTTLTEGNIKRKNDEIDIVTCVKCGRIYLFFKKNKRYRRALTTEMK